MVRRDWLAFAVAGMLLTFMELSPGNIAIDFPTTAIQMSLMLFCLARAGLLGLAACQFTLQILVYAPIAPDFSRWYSDRGAIVMLLMIVATLYVFRVSLKRRHVLLDFGIEK